MLRWIDRRVWQIVDACLFVAIVALVATIALQVISRIANHSTPWTEELSRFLFIWTAFIGMATGFRNGEHPRVDVFINMLPPRWSHPMRFLTPLCAIVFFGIASWYGYRLMLQQLQFGEASPTMGIGMWIVTLPIVLGSVLSIVGSVVAAFVDHQADAEMHAAEDALEQEAARP